MNQRKCNESRQLSENIMHRITTVLNQKSMQWRINSLWLHISVKDFNSDMAAFCEKSQSFSHVVELKFCLGQTDKFNKFEGK